MAAPTSVRVEASSISTTTLRWVYGGAAFLGVYRSTDGSAYTLITSPLLLSTVTSYEDTGLSAGTKYWYKLSDDAGVTFSSVVTVWTHGCAAPAVGGDGFSLPRFDGEAQQSDQLNNLAQRIEATLQGRVLYPNTCSVCPDDGRIVIDCSDGCRSFVVIADQDINSITIQMCQGEGNIDFIIPANVSRGIGGWPSGFGFTGDEGFRAPISGGTTGKKMSVGFECLFDKTNVAAHLNSTTCGAKASKVGSRSGYGGTGGSSGGGGGAGCTCVPGKVGQLTIKSCNADNSLDCSSTKSLTLIACGGKGPYLWSTTGTNQLSATSGTQIIVTPPTNSGSAVAGSAYNTMWWLCDGCAAGACSSVNSRGGQSFSCADVAGACGALAGCTPSPPSVGSLTCCDGGLCTCLPACSSGAADCSAPATTMCDNRTAQMITDGCNPCGLAANGATVSVTDDVGTVVTIILKA